MIRHSYSYNLTRKLMCIQLSQFRSASRANVAALSACMLLLQALKSSSLTSHHPVWTVSTKQVLWPPSSNQTRFCENQKKAGVATVVFFQKSNSKPKEKRPKVKSSKATLRANVAEPTPAASVRYPSATQNVPLQPLWAAPGHRSPLPPMMQATSLISCYSSPVYDSHFLNQDIITSG